MADETVELPLGVPNRGAGAIEDGKPVREYDWGSTGALATLEGREPSGRPEAERHPDDPLVVAPLLLRLHRLQPGQPMYLPNGVPHAYLSGVGVEIMASSDNVVRGGLTSKRVDSQALADLLDPDAAPLLAVPRTPLSPHEVQWQPPVPEFALSRVVVSNIRVTLSRERSDPVGPEVLLCLSRNGSAALLLASSPRTPRR